jgi:hypothetical protein
MRATRAYIASAGTAAVMLAASLCLFAMVSALVAVGSWPGAGSHTGVDALLLKALERPEAKPVAVHRNAVGAAKRPARPRGGSRTVASRTGSGPASRGTAPTTRAPAAGTPLASAPAAPGQTETGGGGGDGSGGGGGATEQAGTVVGNVVDTTEQVTQGVGQQLQDVQTQVQDVQTQVNDVVDQVGDAVDGGTQTVDQTVSGILGP